MRKVKEMFCEDCGDFLMVENEFHRTGGKDRRKIKSEKKICRIAWELEWVGGEVT